MVSESPAAWGAEATLIQLLKSMERVGVESTVVISSGSPFAPHLATHGLHFVEHEFLIRSPAGRVSGNGARQRTIQRLLGQRNLISLMRQHDLVLTFSSWQLPEAQLASRLARRPHAFDLHETFRAGFRTRLLGLLMRQASRCFAPTFSVLEQNGIDRQGLRLSVVPRPVALPDIDEASQERHPADRDRPGPSVAIVGQIAEHKRVRELITAVDWARIGARLTVVGGEASPEKRTAYEAEIRKLAAARSGNVQVINRTSELEKIYSRTDIVVNCSVHEAFGRTAAEAAVYGAYPVAIGRLGPAEVIRDLGWGRILDDFASLEGLLADRDLVEEIYYGRRLAQLKARARFGPQSVAHAYADGLRLAVSDWRPK
ncbi:glycosyltransferase family 4 protein [Cnuibacter sp. UC19_7]|uniref:glycosyltransferase family 4 protein n=1 Tax=Cnuibacter sp. UC19_7 TaxID=3350166 RepID=UPI003670F47E